MINLFGWLKRAKTKRDIIINVERLETRVAVMENGRLEEYMIEHPYWVSPSTMEASVATPTGVSPCLRASSIRWSVQ